MLTKEMLLKTNFIKDICDHISDGINVVDLEGDIVYVNKVSADYARSTVKEMEGRPIEEFYPDAILQQVLETKSPLYDRKIHYVGDKRYVVSSYPVIINAQVVGAFSVFRDIREMDHLNRTIQSLQMRLSLDKRPEDIQEVIGSDGSLKSVLDKAIRSVASIGGTRHSIIVGDSGVGKSMLGELIYNYGKKIGAISSDAAYTELNCSHFSSPEMAAAELFGTEINQSRKGILEIGDGGVLYIEDIHKLEGFQGMLLRAIDRGKFRRLGSGHEIPVNILVIAATTEDNKEHILPELYEVFSPYELYVPSLNERDIDERKELLDYFTRNYEDAVKEYQEIEYSVEFSDSAKELILKGRYPRNISQFKDVINTSIDNASPLIFDLGNKDDVSVKVERRHVPLQEELKIDRDQIHKRVDELAATGLGARRIANRLEKEGIDFKYYQVAYYLNNK